MLSKKFTKEEIIKLNKETSFPEVCIPKERMEIIKELIFNEKSESPYLLISDNKKTKLSSCFVIDPPSDNYKFKPRSASTFKPNSNYNKNYNDNQQNNIIQKAQPVQITRKIKSDSDYYLCRENSISITGSILLEFISQPKQVNLNKDLSYLVNYVNKEKEKKDDPNDKIIIKGRKFSECSDTSGNKKLLNY